MEPITIKSRGRPAKARGSLTRQVVGYIARSKEFAKPGALFASALEQGVMPHSKLLKLLPKHPAVDIIRAVNMAKEAGLVGSLPDGEDYGYYSGRIYWAKANPEDGPPEPIPDYPTVTPGYAKKVAEWDDKTLAERVVSHVFSADLYQDMDARHANALECGLMPRSILVRAARLPAEVLDRGVVAALKTGRIVQIEAFRDGVVARKISSTYYTMASDNPFTDFTQIHGAL